MKAFFVTTQLVEERARVIHVFYFTCGIKPIKDSFKSIGMFRHNSLIYLQRTDIIKEKQRVAY